MWGVIELIAQTPVIKIEFCLKIGAGGEAYNSPC